MWKQSSYCADSQCVQVAFRKASRSTGNGNCVEVGFHKACSDNACVEVKMCVCDEVLLRDSKDPDGPVLKYTRDEWAAFLDGVKNLEFELP